MVVIICENQTEQFSSKEGAPAPKPLSGQKTSLALGDFLMPM